MIQWLRSFVNANKQTKYFVLNWAVYGLAIILTTVYCYARLDYVRSYKTAAPHFKNQAGDTSKKS